MTTLLFNRSDCAAVRAGLSAYIDGELRESRRRRLESHVGVCQRCSAELQRLQILDDHLRRGLAVSLPGPDADRFWNSVERKIEEVGVPRWWGLERVRDAFWFSPRVRWASAAVLATTILLFAADLVLRPSVPPPQLLAPSDVSPGTIVESVEGGPNSSVFLFSTPDQQLKIIWVVQRKKT